MEPVGKYTYQIHAGALPPAPVFGGFLAIANITMARKYLGLNEAEGFHWGMIRGGMSSVADTFVVQMQDCLGLALHALSSPPFLS